MARATPSRTSPPRTASAEVVRRARRTLARVLAITAAVGIAVTATSLLDALPASAAVTTSAYGPDGTHYPSDTPDIRSEGARYTVVDVAASGTAIRKALNALKPAEIAAGVVIRVAPGHIADLSALNGYKNTGGTKVLITARDGFQSVTGGRWALKSVTGITLMRFDIESIDVKGATHSSFAWLRVSGNWVGLTAMTNAPVRDVELIEVVEPESRLQSSDSSQIKAYAPNVMTDVLVEGGYIAPSYYVDARYGDSNPPRPHTDSLQIEGSGITGQVTVRDTVVFGSNNTAVIIGGVKNVAFEQSLIVGSTVASKRYPFLKGGAGFAGAINSAGSLSAVQGSGGGNVDASGSTFIGSLQPTWDAVSDTRTNIPGKVARTGGFTLDPTLSTMTTTDLDELSTRPTTPYLVGIWDDVEWSGVPTLAPTAVPTPTATPAPTAAPTPTATPTPTGTPEPTSAPETPEEPDESEEPELPVADTTAPTVAITSPRSGDVLSGTTTATVTVSDDTAVTGVTFFVGSIRVGDAAPADASTWSLTTSTTGLRGTFPLTARATDAAGNTAVSSPVTVTLR